MNVTTPMSRPDDLDSPDAADRLTAGAGELATRMGLRFVTVSRDLLVASLPVDGNRQPAGLLHGGANAVLAETLGSIHAFVLAPDGTVPVGIELSCTHHRSATAGLVTAECRPLHTGRTLATFEITVSDDRGRRTCTARLTCMYLPADR